MPKLFVSPSELLQLPLGQSPQVQAILNGLNEGVLDQMLNRASQRCESTARRRLQAPGTTTLSASATAGATTVSLTSTLTLDNGSEQACYIGTGDTQELLLINPGGVTVTNWQAPYPGTITLATPLQFSHSSGETVQFVLQEVSVAGHGSSSDPFTEAFTQEAELAQLHAPMLAKGIDLTRMILTKTYPIVTLYKIEYSYSYDTQYYTFDTLDAVIANPNAGTLRLRIGSVILPDGDIRTTYVGGLVNIEQEMKTATLAYMREELKQWVNPFGVVSQNMGKRTMNFGSGGNKSPNILEAEDALKRYKRWV